jgi:hypothetical protein
VYSLAGRQLQYLRGLITPQGLQLIPQGLLQYDWVRSTIEKINRLPVSPERAAAQAVAALSAGRAAGWTTWEIFKLFVSRVVRLPMMFMLLDDEGNPIGLPRRYDPPGRRGT